MGCLDGSYLEITSDGDCVKFTTTDPMSNQLPSPLSPAGGMFGPPTGGLLGQQNPMHARDYFPAYHPLPQSQEVKRLREQVQALSLKVGQASFDAEKLRGSAIKKEVVVKCDCDPDRSPEVFVKMVMFHVVLLSIYLAMATRML